MRPPLAYFLTWTTYGTWLPGDRRGWVRWGRGTPDEPFEQPNVDKRASVRRRLRGAPVRLDRRQRRMAAAAIRRSCLLRSWTVHALNVRSNHVHLVVTTDNLTPEQAMTHLKAWASRRLNERLVGLRPPRWWTRHGSTRYLNTPVALTAAVAYVEKQQ